MMLVHLREPRLQVLLDEADARIVALGKLPAGRIADGAVVARGFISTAWEPIFDGQYIHIDFHGIVHLEAWLTRRYPCCGRDATRRRLRALVGDDGFLTDMLRLLDAALAHEWCEPVGETAWLAERIRKSCIAGECAAAVRRLTRQARALSQI